MCFLNFVHPTYVNKGSQISETPVSLTQYIYWQHKVHPSNLSKIISIYVDD